MGPVMNPRTLVAALITLLIVLDIAMGIAAIFLSTNGGH